MVRIEGGEFVMGILPGVEEEAYFQEISNTYTYVDDDHYRNLARRFVNDQPKTVPTFEISRYLVTNTQYKLFVDDAGYDANAPWWDESGKVWLLRDDAVTEELQPWQMRDFKEHPEWWYNLDLGIARPNHPVTGICWYEAIAFCHWLTQHQTYNPQGYIYTLPSEAEWEYAARRGTRRLYPWGDDEPDMGRANFNAVYHGTTAVGCFATSVPPEEGVYDLAGNVWEWTRSVYQTYPYDLKEHKQELSTPTALPISVRGGGWGDDHIALRVYHRIRTPSDVTNAIYGFRLVRYPPDKA
jgi:formylglycine-generating enzyme required for sulfatase activity